MIATVTLTIPLEHDYIDRFAQRRRISRDRATAEIAELLAGRAADEIQYHDAIADRGGLRVNATVHTR